MPTLCVQLFGDFLITGGDAPITGVNSPRLQSLLAFLILHQDAPQARSQIAFTFWPDTTETNARNNFRQLLFELRRALPHADHFLTSDNTTIQWRAASQCSIDVADFQRALTEAQIAAKTNDRTGQHNALTRATELYRGDLLPNCYDEWIVPERERLRQAFITALENLAELQEHQRDYRAAIASAQQLLQYDPIHESTYRRLMRLHASSGDRASALRTFHVCTTVLHRELAVEPSAETRSEYERLLKRDVQPAPSPIALLGISSLVGREREWAQMQSGWRGAANGRPQMLVLKGEAGIGKTRLMEEFVAWINRQGIPNASAQCYAAEGALAFAPVVAWLRARPLPRLDSVWLTELTRLLPELAARHPKLRAMPLTEEWQRQRLFEGIAHALLAVPQPLLLALDDAQWCDRDTLTFIRYLLRFDSHARLLLICTVRSEEISADHPFTALSLALRAGEQLIEIELPPLNETETCALVSQVLGDEMDDARCARVWREAEGNPLFIIEMARLGLTGEPRALPSKVQAAITSRLAQLTPQARELADIAATIGRAFQFEVLAQASGADEDTLVRGVDELWRRRVVREQSAAYDFSHDKLREVIVASLGPVRTRALHRRVAEALETIHANDLDSVSAQIATHYEQAGRAEQAVAYYERAALGARRVFANQEVIDYYRRALALCDADAPKDRVAQLHENLGDSLDWVGQYDQARVAYQNALGFVDRSVARACLHRKIGNAWREQYHYADALQVYSYAVRVLDEEPGDASSAWWYEWIQLRLEIGLVQYWLGQAGSGEQLRREVEPAIEHHGTPSQRALLSEHVARIELERNGAVATPETVALAQAALAAHQEAKNDTHIPAAQFSLGFHILWSGDPHGAIKPLESALHLAEQRGDISLQARCLTYLTVACRQRDRMEDARKYAERSLQVATAANMPEYIGTARANQSWAAYRAGDFALVRDLGRAALEVWNQLPPGHASARFKWLALFPLIAVAWDAQPLGVAVDYVRVLLDPTLQRLPNALTAGLEQAVRDWEEGNSESARLRLGQTISTAQQMRYL